METRANYVLIGLFTLAVIAGAFGFVFWFQHTGGAGERAQYRVLFDGTVSGLRVGSPVLFNGIRVGEVSALSLNPQAPRQVLTTVSIDPKTPVRADTKVSLEFQGLTGIASLSLTGGGLESPKLKQTGRIPPTLVAEPGANQDVTQTAREVLLRADAVLKANEAALHNSLENVDTFTKALARNSDRLDQIMAGIQNLTGEADKPGELAQSARSLREAADAFRKTVGSFQDLAEKFDQRTADVPETVKSFRRLADNLDKRTAEITASISNLTGPGGRKLEALVSDARQTLTQIDRTVRNFDRNPQRLIFGGSASPVPEYNGRR